MTPARTRFQRILAIDPTYRGFGYAILERPKKLVDWGLCQVRTEKRERTLMKIAELINRYRPDLVVVEETRDQQCRRTPRIRELIEAIATQTLSVNIAVYRVPMAAVREHFAELRATNKDAVARLLVGQFPELEPFLPPKRKAWMPENERMAIFDALAFVSVIVVSFPHCLLSRPSP